MQPVLVWTLVALAAAAVVLVVASSAAHGAQGTRGGGETGATWWSTVRAVLLRRRPAGREGVVAGTRRELAEAADVEPTSVDDIFVVGRPSDVDYVRTDEIARTLARATHSVRVRRGHLARR